MKKKKIALVTGGSGFFGTILIRFLLKKRIKIINFDKTIPDQIPKGVKFIKGNILNSKDISNAAKNVDIIFHNVANLPLAENKNRYGSINVDGTRNMLEAALKNKVKKVIYTSTGAVFGIPKINPISSNQKPVPKEEYGLTKLLGEKECLDFVKKGVSVTIIRPNTILGVGRLGTLSLLFKWVDEGYNIPVFDGGKNIYQFTHALDLSELSYRASLEKKSEIYNCGAKDRTSMKDVMLNLCKFAKTQSKVKSVPMWPAIIGMNLLSYLNLSPLGAYHSLMYGRSIFFNMSKNKRRLNWRPKYSNKDMIIEGYKWYLKNKIGTNYNKKNYEHQGFVDEGFLKYFKKIL